MFFAGSDLHVADERCRGVHVTQASCGGVTHWALANEEDGSILTVAFGQGAANGTLSTSMEG